MMLEATLDTGDGAFFADEQTRISVICRLTNRGHSPANTAAVRLIVRNLSAQAESLELPVAANLRLAPGGNYESVIFVPRPESSASVPACGAYGVYLLWTGDDGERRELCRSFFRVVHPGDLLQYEIRRTEYGGFPVFLLDGGMSAEYAVLKSAEALAATACPSWVTKAPGYGPRECHAVPDFIRRSAERTTAFYDDALGADVPFDTVIVATGVSSIAYIARTVGAPVLPLHFLVSADTVEEIAAMLDHAGKAGIAAYATLGHDASVDMAVAWMKLLDLPAAYRDFLVRHRTKRVLFAGCGGLNGGENVARKVLRGDADADTLSAGDIYIMHPYGGTEFDERELARKIRDLADYPTENGLRRISDWESGVVETQIARFSQAIRAETDVRELFFLTADTYMDLYNLATYAVLAFYKKNENLLAPEGAPVKGLVLNPYLICHPFYESSRGQLPFVFFQGEAVAARLDTTIREAISAYFPDVRLEVLPVQINTTRNFGGYALHGIVESLRGMGFRHIAYGDQSVDEVWDPSDGMNAPAEAILASLNAAGVTHRSLRDWDNRLTRLTAEDLQDIAGLYPAVHVRRLSDGAEQ